MRQSSNLGLALYDKTDLMNITGLENSLNHNMELIDLAINQLLQNKADKVEVSASDNGKFLCVVNGEWAAVAYPIAEDSTF